MSEDLILERDLLLARSIELVDEMNEYRTELAEFRQIQISKGYLPKAQGIERADAKLALKEAGAEHQRVIQRIGQIGRQLKNGSTSAFLPKAIHELLSKTQADAVFERAQQLQDQAHTEEAL